MKIGTTRRSPRVTHSAARFAVAGELSKRGYEVTPAGGIYSGADMGVTSPEGTTFVIDVKGLYKRNFFILRPKPTRADLFYVLAYVPDGGSNRFFVLSQAEANRAVADGLEHSRRIAIAKGKAVEEADDFPCIAWKRAEPFEGRWVTLPR